MQFKHRPSTFTNDPDEIPDVSVHVPEYKRSQVLSIVKWYPNANEVESHIIEEKTLVDPLNWETKLSNGGSDTLSFLPRRKEESRGDRLIRKAQEHLNREVEIEAKKYSSVRTTDMVTSVDKIKTAKTVDASVEEKSYLASAGRGPAYRAQAMAESQRKFLVSDVRPVESLESPIEVPKVVPLPQHAAEVKSDPYQNIERVSIPFKRAVIEKQAPKEKAPESASVPPDVKSDETSVIWSSFEILLLHQVFKISCT